MNWYFIAASTFFLLPILWYVTKRIVIPHLGTYESSQLNTNETMNNASISPKEARAIRFANISFLITLITLTLLSIKCAAGSVKA
ncbi:AbgT family transporter [Staphylococcus agnetis]|uniref:AbgT family transporter n=1 Tax=Staphylococcus agnetis TaxID=985762 RepID=UPI003CC90EFA